MPTIDHLEEAPVSKNVIGDRTAEKWLADAELQAGEAQEKMTAFAVFLSCVAAVSGFCFGYDTGVISAALVNIRGDLGHLLSDVEKEWIGSATSVGALIGALSGGVLSDRIGRKWVLAIGDVWFTIGAVVIAASFSVPQIICGRLFLGFGVGIASATAPTLIAELSPARFRGTLVTIQSLAITGGQFISYCFGIPLTGDGGWRWLFVIGIAPALAQGLSIHFLPESPRYDLMRGRDEAARKTLNRIYKGCSPDYIDLKFNVLKGLVDISGRFQEKYTVPQRLKLVFTTGHLRRPAITAMGLGVFQQLCGFNTLMYYSTTIFQYAGFKNPTSISLVVSGANFACTVIAFFILDRVGKRRILICGYPGMIAGLVLAAVAFAKMTEITGGKLIEGTEYSHSWSNMMLGMMVLFIASYATGLGNIPWQGIELFPLEVRGIGSSLLAGSVWSANIFVSASFLSIMNGIGASGAFGFYSGICTLGFVFVIFCYPEVTGLSLEEIGVIFQHGFGIKKSQEIRASHRVAKEVALKGELAVRSGDDDESK
ncbi:general substrate transporter [Meredithblackwellia eburnea MCA 4105]